MDSSDDEFDKILIDNSKLSKHFDELNDSSGRTVLQAADWSNSIAEVGKNGVVSKSKVDKKSENQKLCRIDPPSGSDTNDDELDASLMSYAVNVNSGDDEKAKQKKNVSPGKTSSPINSLDRKKKDKIELELQPTAASSPKNHSVTEINKTRHSQVRNHLFENSFQNNSLQLHFCITVFNIEMVKLITFLFFSHFNAVFCLFFFCTMIHLNGLMMDHKKNCKFHF